jgi:NAD(P)-dependent dehydrogenase (short-subunit alcohol dehydrogenase family)
VALLDVSSSTSDVARQLRDAGSPKTLALNCDVSDPNAVESAFSAIAADLGPVDGLFTSAGIDRGGMAHEITPEQWRLVMAINLDGTFFAVQCALRQMMESRGGSIVCCSSPASFVAFAAGGASAYSASKGAVSALVRTLAVDYASYAIRVNALVPGSTETPLMWSNVEPNLQPAVREVLSGEIPLGRLARAEEPARAAMWLLSAESSYVTGSHLVCDGGTLAKGSVSV